MSSSSSSDSDSSDSDSRPSTPELRFTRREVAPSSPPETPTTSSFASGDSPRDARRNGVHNFSRPLPRAHGEIHPVGQGHNFNYIPQVRLEDLSPRSSTSSSETSEDDDESLPGSLSSEALSVEPISQIESPLHHSAHSLIAGNFTIEEVRDTDSDSDSDGDLSVIHPDHYEDAESERAASVRSIRIVVEDIKTTLLAGEFENLDCNPRDSHEAWIRHQRTLKRRKRLSSGSIHKRTLSQSIGSETDDEDIKPYDANEVGASASGLRRLRRKTGERISLIFDDPPQRIVECDEPDSDDDIRNERIPDVEEVLMLALPYYEPDTDMEY